MKNILYLIIIIILFGILSILFLKNYETFTSDNTNSNNNDTNSDNKNNYFKDKVIIITGSTSGIGLSLAKVFSKLDCKLVIHGRSETKINSVLEKFNNNPNIIGVVADLEDEKNFDILINTTIDKFKKIDILVNNIVNRSGSKKLVKKNYGDWKKEMNVNINSIFYLTQKVIEQMKTQKEGKIINISSNESKDRSTKISSGTQILSKTFLERMSEILSDETEKENISIGVIRVDTGNYANKKVDTSKMKNNIIKNTYETINSFVDMVYDDPDNITGIFLDIIKLPHHQLNGKIYSTTAFKENSKLSKIIPSYQLLINKNLYKEYKFTKNKKPGDIYLTKQNPYGTSDKIKKFIKEYDLSNSLYNINNKYESKLDKTLSEKLNVDKDNIVFFKTELDALRKIITIFTTKYSNIFCIYPNNEYIEVLSNELKLGLKFTTYKVVDKSIQPDYSHIINNINAKTKIIYLASPNLLTGQSIKEKEFEEFLNKIPDNIIIIINQSMVDFVDDNNQSYLNPLKYLNKNVLVIRNFSNFYGFENLELSYVVASKDIAKILDDSNIIQNQLDTFNENLAIECLNDVENNTKMRKKMTDEKNRIYKLLDESNMEYFKSDTYYLLINPKKDKEQIYKLLENNKIILENSDLHYNSYWPLPLSTPDINNKLVDILITKY